MWDEFLHGALRSYTKFGVQRVLEYDEVRTGRSTSLFFTIVDGHDHVIGGVRVQGPYLDADQSHALVEWDGAPGSLTLRRLIESRIDDRMVEMKTGWVNEAAADRHALAGVIARTPMHAMALTDSRFALCTVADHAVRRWCSTGAVVSESVPAVAYPDDRYRTVPIWWERAKVRELMDPRCGAVVDDEWWQITQSASRLPLSSAQQGSLAPAA